MRARFLFLLGLGLAMAWQPAAAQDSDKGKSAQELFRTNCSICHRNSRDLGTSMGAWSLAGFLTEHYTTSKATASVLAGYLASLNRPGEGASPQRRREPTGRRKSN